MPETMLATIRDWWPFGVFVIGGWVSFMLGRERQRWRIDQIGRRLDDQDKRLSRLEVRGQEESILLAEIKTSQAAILSSIADLRAELRGKADK